MKLIIDRFEGDIAVLEDESERHINVKKSDLPADSKEGSVLDFTDGIYTVDENATDERRKHIEDLSKRLFSKRRQG